MDRLPVVDAVIPVYNRKEIFFECLDSVLKQDYPEIEIYVVEDGSGCLDEKKLKQISPRIHYYRNASNKGPSFSRNTGAGFGQGNFIAFLDSDDLWAPRKISSQVEFLRSHPSLNWVHTNEVWIRNGIEVSQKKEHAKQGGKFFERLLLRCLISPSAVFFNRKFFESSGGFLGHLRVGEDYELWLRLNLFHEIGYIDEPLTIKRAGNWDQLSRTIEIDRFRVLAMHRIYRLYHNEPEFKPFKDAWKSEILKKINILIKGAEKYQKEKALRKYQSWLKLFTMF